MHSLISPDILGPKMAILINNDSEIATAKT